MSIHSKQEFKPLSLDVQSMLDHGLHLGHLSRFWNPKMKDYIFKVRYGVHIINLVKTETQFKRALSFIEKIVSKGGKILFVGTKPTARDIIAEQAQRCFMPYVNHRWLGGMLTNFKTVKQSINRLVKLQEMSEQGILDKLTKKEALMKRREIDKLEKTLGGIKKLSRLPDALLVIDVGYEDIAVKEANKLGIPVIGLIDTNNSPDGIQFPIPANDDAIRAISYSVGLIAQTIEAARLRHQENQKQDAKQLERAPAPQPQQKKEKTEQKNSKDKKREASQVVANQSANEKNDEQNGSQAISAAAVKQLRDLSGAGMMECKKALVEAEGDLDKAVEILAKYGQKKIQKSSARTAAEGVIEIVQRDAFVGMIEINCETDFVARDEIFLNLRETIKNTIQSKPQTHDELLAMELDGVSIQQMTQDAITKIGEKIEIRRSAFIDNTKGKVGFYNHSGKMAALVTLKNENDSLARDLAMHIAAMKPVYKQYSDIPAAIIEKQKEIFDVHVQEDNKPADIKDKIVQGKLQKHFSAECLMDQSFIKNPDLTISKLLQEQKNSIESYIRFEVGEGIEKVEVDFAQEVMSQVRK